MSSMKNLCWSEQSITGISISGYKATKWPRLTFKRHQVTFYVGTFFRNVILTTRIILLVTTKRNPEVVYLLIGHLFLTQSLTSSLILPSECHVIMIRKHWTCLYSPLCYGHSCPAIPFNPYPSPPDFPSTHHPSSFHLNLARQEINENKTILGLQA